MTVFVNGTAVAAKPIPGGLSTSATDIHVGHFPGGGGPPEAFFVGGIDEVLFFDRALQPVELASIVGAGAAGTCPLVCKPAPSGLVSWWSGDVDTRDQFGPNDGVIVGAVALVPGRVRGAFSFVGPAGGAIVVPDSPSLEIAGPMTIDAWIAPLDPTPSAAGIVTKTSGSGDGYALTLNAGKLSFTVGSPDGRVQSRRRHLRRHDRVRRGQRRRRGDGGGRRCSTGHCGPDDRRAVQRQHRRGAPV
jgi:hypothetical protein